MDAEIVVKAIVRRKCDFAISGSAMYFQNGHGTICTIEHDAAVNPNGPSARFMKERNARIERYAEQAANGHIQFE